MGFWQKLKKIYMGDVFGSAISEADEAFFDDLEEMLILADVGLETATEVVKELRQRMIEDKISGQEPVKACLREILAEKLQVGDGALNISTRPSVVLVVGVNGVGKTTSIGKLANSLRLEGKRVLLCAGDTFRAAAADLMAELAKLRKIIDRELPEAALEILLVLDATTGQNGLIQARQFKEISGCTGIVLTKLDGTAKGGIVVAIAQALQVPVKFVGLGEGISDMQPFDAREYVEALI